MSVRRFRRFLKEFHQLLAGRSSWRLPGVVTELKQAGLITNAQCRGLDEISGVVWAQSGKSPEVVAKTADVLDKHGFEEESRLLEVLSELQQADLISSEECRGLYDISGVVEVQSGKSPEVVAKTADVLRRHGFEKEGDIVLLARGLQLMTSTGVLPKEQFQFVDWEDEFMARLSDQPPNRLVLLLQVLGVPIDDILSSCPLSLPCGGPSPSLTEIVIRAIRRHGKRAVADVCATYLMEEKSYLAAEANLQHLVDEELPQLISDYATLKELTDAAVERLPKQSRRILCCARKTVSSLMRRACGENVSMASKVLDTRELRQRIQALRDPELLQQLSSYEEAKLKPFIATFLDRCRENGVQPDSSQPDVLLSPSTPAGQVLGFILSRKDYYVTDLHINRELFSPWHVDTPPPAQAPLTLDGPDLCQHMGTLRTSYAALFTKVVENVETLPRHQYLNLRSFFQFDHTEVHLPSSQKDVRDRLHLTPLFAPLCTALLRKVVWFLFTRDADNLSHQLEDYEEKLGTFVNQFLLACHKEGVVPAPEGVSLNEDECDLSDPAHLLACVLELKPYYVGSLCVDESLFTTLQREGSLDGGGGSEENGSMDAAPLEPTPPTSESESSGSSVSPQSKEKGKHRVGTSPSTVPVKRSAQGEDGEGEEEEEKEGDTAGSTAMRRRRETSHMTVAEILECFQDEFLKAMNAKALSRRLTLMGIIPEAAEIEIQAKSTDEANIILYRHLHEQGTKASLRQLCEVASEKKGYGKMNELGRRILKEL